ncbi:MAG TPA: VacJ family lipoprotein [Steroidobacteraceae bacterium]
MPTILRAGLAPALTLILAGCATTGAPTPGDPLERWNRGVQRVNDALDRAVLRPVAVRYQRHVPRALRTGIGNVLSHLAFPTTIANDLLQGKLKATAQDIGRFALNSTLGLGGLLDPASDAGLPRNDEDFGQTLGRWGAPPGPYLVLPLLGPSTLRDAPAMAADAQADLRVQLEIRDEERAALGALYVLDRRAALLAADPAIDAAFDRYAFIRDAWLQRREYQVRDGDVPEEPPLEDFEDLEGPAEPAAPAEPVDQPVPGGSSRPSTSLMPASAASAAGALR